MTDGERSAGEVPLPTKRCLHPGSWDRPRRVVAKSLP